MGVVGVKVVHVCVCETRSVEIDREFVCWD